MWHYAANLLGDSHMVGLALGVLAVLLLLRRASSVLAWVARLVRRG